MIQKRGLPTAVWVFLGLLLIAAFATGLGGEDAAFNPATTNFGPSGVSAFYELLSRMGYNVVVDRRSNPLLGKHDVAITFTETRSPDAFVMPADPEEKNPFDESIRKFLTNGGRVLNFDQPSGFPTESKALLKSGGRELSNPISHQKLQVFTEGPSNQPPNLRFAIGKDGENQTLWSGDREAIVWTASYGKGRLVNCASAFPISNRFLDKGDDAQFVMSLIDSVAEKGDRIVLAEASHSEADDPGLIESIGAWAVGAWRQIIVLGLVVVYTLGRRFGYPEERRKAQQGSRELLDAVADLYQRGKKTDIALQAAYETLDHRLRIFLRIPRDASEGERDRLLPEEVISALQKLTSPPPNGLKIGTQDALARIQAAEDEVNGYLLYVTRERSA
jgi:hypothetical protein